jgi:hypothetical protein
LQAKCDSEKEIQDQMCSFNINAVDDALDFSSFIHFAENGGVRS